MSSEHFTVDGTLIEAWASLKSFQPKDDERRKDKNRRKAQRRNRRGKGPKGGGSNPTVDFHGQKRSNKTHESTTDPEARLARKGPGKEAKLSYAAHALMENRNGLLVDLRMTEANGTAERDAALFMLLENLPGNRRITVGADRGYDSKEFVEQCHLLGVVPHVAQHTNRRNSAVDARTTRHAGYSISQRLRKRVEEIFGWAKSVGSFRRIRFKGRRRTELAGYFVAASYNLVRMAKLRHTRSSTAC